MPQGRISRTSEMADSYVTEHWQPMVLRQLTAYEAATSLLASTPISASMPDIRTDGHTSVMHTCQRAHVRHFKLGRIAKEQTIYGPCSVTAAKGYLIAASI